MRRETRRAVRTRCCPRHPHGGVPVRPSLDTRTRKPSRRSGPRSTSRKPVTSEDSPAPIAALDVVDQTGRGNQMRSALDASINTPAAPARNARSVGARPPCITSVRDATPVDEAAERCRGPVGRRERPLTRAQAQDVPRGSSRWGATSKVGASAWPSCTRSTVARLPSRWRSATRPRWPHIAFWAGDFEMAERAVRPAFQAVQRFGAPSTSRMAALLADALCGIGDLEGPS